MEKVQRTTLTLFERQIKWSDKHSISLSKLVRRLLDEEIKRRVG